MDQFQTGHPAIAHVWRLTLAAVAGLSLGACGGSSPATGPASSDSGLDDALGNPAVAERPTLSPQSRATLAAAAGTTLPAGLCSETSLGALREVWQAHPTDPEVRDTMRHALDACQQWDGLAEVLEAKPDSERTDAERLELARLYLRNLGSFEEAEALAVPLATRYPEDPDIVSLAAASLYYQDRMAEAAPMVDRLWETIVQQRNTDIMTMRAVAFINDGNPERAARILEQVLEFNDSHAFAWTTLARARQAMGDEEGAQTALLRTEELRAEERELTRVSQRASDLAMAARQAWERGDHEAYEQYALDLIDVLPPERRPDVYRDLGAAYNEMNRPKDARAAYETAAEIERQLEADESATPGEPADGQSSGTPIDARPTGTSDGG